MKRTTVFAAGLTLAVGLLPGCSGSDSSPVLSGGPTSATATEDQRTPQSDDLTAAEMAQVNQANAEPVPALKPDL
jgi:hypothetical protein